MWGPCGVKEIIYFQSNPIHPVSNEWFNLGQRRWPWRKKARGTTALRDLNPLRKYTLKIDFSMWQLPSNPLQVRKHGHLEQIDVCVASLPLLLFEFQLHIPERKCNINRSLCALPHSCAIAIIGSTARNSDPSVAFFWAENAALAAHFFIFYFCTLRMSSGVISRSDYMSMSWLCLLGAEGSSAWCIRPTPPANWLTQAAFGTFSSLVCFI